MFRDPPNMIAYTSCRPLLRSCEMLHLFFKCDKTVWNTCIF